MGDGRHRDRTEGWIDGGGKLAGNVEVGTPGVSVVQAVTASDEWCAEAYMETDYSKIGQADFEKVVRDYAVYRLLNCGEG